LQPCFFRLLYHLPLGIKHERREDRRQTVDSEALDGRDHVVAVDALEAHVVARTLLPCCGHEDEMTQESHVVRHLRVPDLNRLRHDCARWRTRLNCQGRVSVRETVRESIRGCMRTCSMQLSDCYSQREYTRLHAHIRVSVRVRESIRGCMRTFVYLPANLQPATLRPVLPTLLYTEERDFHFLASIVGGGQQLNRQTLTHCQVVHMP
jgi:hypothetical protein